MHHSKGKRMKQQVTLHRDDLVAIKEFTEKYPQSDFINITVDSSSGIGSIVKVSLPTVINGDLVTIEKTIVDESSW
jgi:hypothetical protein